MVTFLQPLRQLLRAFLKKLLSCSDRSRGTRSRFNKEKHLRKLRKASVVTLGARLAWISGIVAASRTCCPRRTSLLRCRGVWLLQPTARAFASGNVRYFIRSPVDLQAFADMFCARDMSEADALLHSDREMHLPVDFCFPFLSPLSDTSSLPPAPWVGRLGLG